MLKFILYIFLTISLGYSNQVCSRVAKVNYQDILVDAGSGKRGEGLRFYLEKDAVSKALLNDYQDRNKPSIWNAAASTAGSLMILASFFQTGEKSNNRNGLMFTGATIIGLSYLIDRSFRFNNEKILDRAVQEYNSRNKPQIYFSPFENNGNFGIGASIKTGF